MSAHFTKVLDKYRKISFSEKDKGERFERLMKAYLLTDPKYANLFKKVWLWSEFPGKNDLGGWDTGIDLVAYTNDGDYWAIQCKCYAETTTVDKKAVDSFLSTSSRSFKNEDLQTTHFSQCLLISTSNRWSVNAEEALKNQKTPVSRLTLLDLKEAPVDWEKLENNITGELARTAKKELRKHQEDALKNTNQHFKENDRGKLIMACGTGKTFTSLRIAENETSGKGFILFLVPSIALLGQTLNEWSADAEEPINAICICSDAEITKKKSKVADIDTTSVIDLALPASTNVPNIVNQFQRLKKHKNDGMTVVFSTYQSIDVIAKAQAAIAKEMPEYSEFDLIICDEAHRTTGVSLAGEDESAFVKVHNNDFIKAKKRLYMTATPRLYNEETKSKAAKAEALLCSMDDVTLYGEEMYRIGFGEAVEKDLLTDYKVLILTLSENDVPPIIQNMIRSGDSEIKIEDAPKLVGCINALSKQVLGDEGIIKETDPEPMRRAVAFCSTIANSEVITSTFNNVEGTYVESLPEEAQKNTVNVSSRHIDGSMSATTRNELLGWLKDEPEDGECRILTNVRCLSEGVDVPSLDAVMFLSARNSQVDVVQSVGRVMRKAPNKKYGYIIIPVVVPSTVSAEEALDDNERFKVVWTVLNALRAHDDRFNATVNKIELNKKRPSQIIVGPPPFEFDDQGNPVERGPYEGSGSDEIGKQLSLQFEELQNVVFARMVQKVGDRRYWEQWAKSVGEIATRQKERIINLIVNSSKHAKEFERFLKGLRKSINPSIEQEEAVDMLSQHIITKPVFEALFEGYSFAQNNAMSQSMQKMLDLLEEETIEEDAKTLESFYESVKMRASGIDNSDGKQKIIIELYDKFFKTAFPKMVEQLGIVYTPIEVVDFIVHSVADVLQKEFGRNISEENIHILDPFTGTGTFITRLLQSGLINKEDLERKYKKEIHANEIVLLAYYIASVNIENVFHDMMGDTTEYQSFDGICLTDTFQLGETKEGEVLFDEMFPQNSKRVAKQQKTPIKIIVGNPPYSRGQEDANDFAKNQSYPLLESKILQKYSQGSDSNLKRDLYNSYIKAFRWATDRLADGEGIIGFVTGSGIIDKLSYSGFRKSLFKEFSSINVINLRGDIRGKTKMASKREGQNVFDIMTGVAITILVKNKNYSGDCKINYYSLDDFLSKDDKLKTIKEFISLENIEMLNITPNENGDWINQRSNKFEDFFPLSPVKNFDKNSKSFFIVNPIGISTNRDNFVYNYSSIELEKNINGLINFYEDNRKLANSGTVTKDKVLIDESKIKWTDNLIKKFKKNEKLTYEHNKIVKINFRPFNQSFLYNSKSLIERPSQNESIIPNGKNNLIIGVPGKGGRRDFCSLVFNSYPNINNFDGGTQLFPLYFYEVPKTVQKGLFDDPNETDYVRRDAVSDFILDRAKKQYGKNVTKEDLFYYVYGFLHSKDYRETFANDLKKMLPKLPLLDDVKDFWKFSNAGRKLADLHLNYEEVAPYPDVTVTGKEKGNFIVEKMRFPKKDQKDTIYYNGDIVISNIPAKAYEYVVNGKSAIEWIMERYQVTTHKDSGITNNPNDWAAEVGNPRYILDLLLSIINVSVQTVDIVNDLPKLSFD